jgi:hypothetical protein
VTSWSAVNLLDISRFSKHDFPIPACFDFRLALTCVTDHDDLENFVRFQTLVVLLFRQKWDGVYSFDLLKMVVIKVRFGLSLPVFIICFDAIDIY